MKFLVYFFSLLYLVAFGAPQNSFNQIGIAEYDAVPLWNLQETVQRYKTPKDKTNLKELKYLKIDLDQVEHFPHLNLLDYIDSCPSLEQIFVNYPSGMITNHFSDELTTKFDRLKHLYRLVVEIDSTDYIPKLISNNSCVKYLQVRCNYVDFMDESAIASDSLKVLELNVLKCLKSSIDWSKSKNIEYLGLCENLEHTISNLSDLKNLKQLNYYNQFCTELPDNFFNISTLAHLSLVTPRLKILSDKISYFKELKSFTFTSEKIEFLPNTIGTLEKLMFLSLTVPNLKKLEPFHNATELERLFINAPSLVSLPESFGGSKKLKLLILHLSSKIDSFTGLGKYQAIEELVILGCNPVFAFDEILKLNNLHVLEISACFIEESHLSEFIKIKKSSIKHLYIPRTGLNEEDNCPERYELLMEKLKGVLPNRILK
jgi:hypothetical protein